MQEQHRKMGGLRRRATYGALVFLAFVIPPTKGRAEADNVQERLQAVFFPYRHETPKIEGLTPGVKIDKSNAQIAAEALPPELLDHLAAGEFSITVQETTDTPLRKEYIEASIQHYGKAALGGGNCKTMSPGCLFHSLIRTIPKLV